MRLYPRDETTVAVDHAGVHYEPADDGGFDFPAGLSDQMHSVHVRGRAQWEDAIERQNRMITEEAARRADPATLLDAVEQLVKAARATGEAAKADAPKADAPKAAPKAAPPAKSDDGK